MRTIDARVIVFLSRSPERWFTDAEIGHGVNRERYDKIADKVAQRLKKVIMRKKIRKLMRSRYLP